MTDPDVQQTAPDPGTVTEPVAVPPRPPVAPPVFTPASPEGTYQAPVAPVASARPTSRALTYVLVGAVLIGAIGVSFAVGRASTSPAPVAARGQAAFPGGQGAGNPGFGNGSTGNGRGPLGGQGPNASFDLNGGPGPGDGGDPDNGLGFDRGFGRGFGPGGLTGTVTSIAADAVTVQLANGRSVTFKLDGSTTYHQQVAASASDVKQGSTVQVSLGAGFDPGQITQGSDGTITLGTAGNVTVVP